MKNCAFYSPDEISADLAIIDQHREEILQEVLNNTAWMSWPDAVLDRSHDGWKVYPFYALGDWDKEACKSCPVLASCLRKISGLRMATLAKLESHTKMHKHYGYSGYCNYNIRCHYGLVVPLSCHLTVCYTKDGKEIEETRYHEKFKFICFDDSKQHYAENASDEDRIILMIDMVRPSDIEVGNSQDHDPSELQALLEQFRKRNAK
jgi:aspartyl/asparaginyl beta-hydroxylase (cupin superfamily)